MSALLRAAETTREEDETTRVDDASGSARPGERSLRPPFRAPLPSGRGRTRRGTDHYTTRSGAASVAVVRLLLRAPGGTAAAAAANDARSLPAHVAAAGRVGGGVRRGVDAYPAARGEEKRRRDNARGVAEYAGATEDVQALFAMTSDEETA